ncbi:MAG: F0F1 ATP synthase subunit alpha [Rhizobium sp.]
MADQPHPPGGYRFGLRVSERGYIVGIGDGIAWVKGLPSARIDEMLEFADGSRGLVFQLDRDLLGAIILRQTHDLTAGMSVLRTGRTLLIGTGDDLLGRVIDPLGGPLDGMPAPEVNNFRSLEAPAPSILDRDTVSRPLYTGSKIADALIPIGKGQRQLVIGDDGTGKSAFVLDAVLSQHGRDVRCVMVLIGQTRSTIAATVTALREGGALAFTTLVVAEADMLPGFRFLAPFAGCAIAEQFMRAGKDTLIVYDDLTQHAQSYRELSLLLRRPPGREAYPGDIFYLHSRLLERSTQLSKSDGGGSMTALPVVATQQGEIAAYIPTNIISITDGQIYFDSKLFASGILPAIDISRSVSRIGGAAQHKAVKTAAARIRLEYLQFLEMELFARFGTKLEKGVEEKLKRGRLLREILKQDRLSPLNERQHLAWLTAYGEGLLDPFPPSQAAARLPSLYEAVELAGLSLDDPKERWRDVLEAALTEAQG